MRTNRKLLLLPCALLLVFEPNVLGAQAVEEPSALPAAEPTIEDSQFQQVGHAACQSNSYCCEPVCCPNCVSEEVEKVCWCVKPELVCIPGFRWPWECCDDDCGCNCNCTGAGGSGCGCPPRCGRVRCINVLEQHKYTCDECGYEWEVKWVRSRGRHSSAHGGCPNCGPGPASGPCASRENPDGVELTAATEPLSTLVPVEPAPTLWERLGFK